MTTDMLDAARRYVAAGLSVVPVRKWSKQLDYQALGHPKGQPRTDESDAALFAPYTERMPTDQELANWFLLYNDCNLAIVGGQVSGGLVRLDFEHQACLTTWYSLLAEDRDLFAAAAALPVVQTGNGHHIYFRMADPPGHVVLCAHGTGDEAIVFSETQGEGCYCLAPPTKHINDRGEEFSYMWVSRCGFEAIPALDQELPRSSSQRRVSLASGSRPSPRPTGRVLVRCRARGSCLAWRRTSRSCISTGRTLPRCGRTCTATRACCARSRPPHHHYRATTR